VSTYKYELESLVSALQGQTTRLEQLNAQASNATSRSEYDRIASAWSSTKASYESTYGQYVEVSDRLSRSMQARRVTSEVVQLDNPKDRFQWYAGGNLRNETLAGGSMFDVGATPAVYNKPRDMGFASTILSGNTLNMLNSGYGAVLGAMNATPFMDILTDYTLRQTAILLMHIEIRDSGGVVISSKTDVLWSSEGDRNGDASNNTGTYGTAAGTPDYGMLSKAMNAQTDLTSLTNPVSIAGFAFDLATGKLESFEVAAVGGLIGTVNSTFTNVATRAAAQALGLTNMAAVGALGYTIGALVGELMEMAMGLDNSFGFGGEFVGTNPQTMTPSYSLAKSPLAAVKDMFKGFTDVLGFTTPDFVDVEFTTNFYKTSLEAWGPGGYMGSFVGGGFVEGGFGDTSPSINMGKTTMDLNTGMVTLNDTPFTDSYFTETFSGYSGNNTPGAGPGGSYGSIGGDTPNAGASGPSGSDSPGMGNSSGDGFSCFVAGTKVHTTNGVKNIEEVKIGDILVGEGGSHNEVLEYDCPMLGDRLVYSINGGEPFVTSEHPFKTNQGWKAIDVLDTLQDSPEAYGALSMEEAGSLRIGDKLETTLGYLAINSIKGVAMPKNTQLYNFRLSNNQTYYANGFLVHNK